MGPASNKLDAIIHRHKRGAQEGGVLNNCIFPLAQCVLISLRTYTYMSVEWSRTMLLQSAAAASRWPTVAQPLK